MKIHSIGLVFLLAAAPATAAPSEPARDTVTTIRNVGTALAMWLVDNVERPFTTEEEAPASIDWSKCEPLTDERAADLLEPEYIAELPRVDGWGHPLELCLHQSAAPTAVHAIGARSAGADGIFEGDLYEVGPFDPRDQDRDVVWVDGFFVRWPQARQ
jgi:hypothetical protein